MRKTTPNRLAKDAKSLGKRRGAPPEQAALIDQLMALPIKDRPRITVIGDDAVSGINPAPPPKAAR